MIIKQTTTLIFEYPQDYLQEQEWCKTKEDRWIHKGTDTLGAVYENTISYSIGQPSNSEIPNNWEDFFREPTAEERKAVADYIYSISVPTGVNIFDLMDEPTISKMEQVDKDTNVRSKDEPQTNADQHIQHVGSVEPTWTKEEHEAFYTFLWNVINPNEMQDYIEMFETKDEQTEREGE